MQNVSSKPKEDVGYDGITNHQLIAEAKSSRTNFAGIFQIPYRPLITSIIQAAELFPRSSLFGYRVAADTSFILSKDQIRSSIGYPPSGAGDLYITDNHGLCKNSPTDSDAIARMRDARENNIPIILFFGGSTVMGEGAKSPRFSIPAQVETLLKKNGKDAVCVNFGLLGSYSYTSLLFLIAEGFIVKPSFVIFYDGWNCLYEYKLNKLIHRSKKKFPIKVYPGSYLSIHQVKNDIAMNQLLSLAYLIRRVSSLFLSHVFAFIARILPYRPIENLMIALTGMVWESKGLSQDKLIDSMNLGSSKDVTENFSVEEGVEEYMHTHILAKNFAESQGAKYMTILQPLLFLGGKKLTNSEEIYVKNLPPFTNKDEYQKFYDGINMRGSDINLENFSDVFDKIDDQIYYDEGHINARGNLIISTRISSLLLDQL